MLIGTTSANASKLNVYAGTSTSPYGAGIDFRAGNTGPWLFRNRTLTIIESSASSFLAQHLIVEFGKTLQI